MAKIKKTLTTIGIWLAAQILVTLVFMIVALAQSKDIYSVLAPALLYSDLLVIIILIAIKYCGIKELFKTVPADIFLFSIVFALCGMYAVEMLSSGFDIPNALEEQFKAMSKTLTGFFAICIVGPIMEEIMMRRVILKEIEKATKSMWWGIIISAALFAIIHVNPIQVVFAMPAGIILGWLYCKTGSLLVPICIHILNNTAAFITMRMDSDSDFTIRSPFGVTFTLILIFVCAATCIWIVRRYAKLKKEQELLEATVAEPAETAHRGAFEGNSYDK